MDVDAMDELMYDNLIRYFKTLAHTGYKSYDVVFKMLVMNFIYEITHTELRYYITNEDIKLMRDLLYQFFGSTCEASLPTNRPCCKCVCCDEGSSTPPPVIVPTTTSTTTSTQPPVKTLTVVFEHDPKTAYTITYNGSDRLTVSDLEDEKIKLNFSAGVNNLQFTINSIVCANSNYECKEVRQGMLSHSLPYSISVAANQYITITPVITDSEPTTTTTTSSTTTSTTSTLPPVGGNNVYYGVVEDYMPPLDFVDTPINTLMEREGTKSKTITGTEVNKFTIPQNGYYTYLIVPVDKVELQYAAFTSGGITTVCYDNTKENIPDDTNNGIFYSKYTRGGVNANQGGAYNGINYDVYFIYNNYGGAPELINVKAKNK